MTPSTRPGIIWLQKTFAATILMAIVSLLPSQALAWDNVYHTSGGFVPIDQAFLRISLIFNDPEYRSLFLGIITLSMFGAGAINIFRAVQGGKGGALSWFGPVLTAAVVYMTLFAKHEDLIVYDDMTNTTSQAYSIPLGIARAASTINYIETRLVEIVNDTSEPGAYSEAAGGIGFQLLRGLSRSKVPDGQIAMLTNSYIQGCALFEIERPGGTLTLNELVKPTAVDPFATRTTATYTSFADMIAAWVDNDESAPAPLSPLMVSLEKAANPALFIDSPYTEYEDGTPTNASIGCDDAYETMKSYYMDKSNFRPAIEQACNSVFIDRSEIARCQSLLNSTMVRATGTGLDAHMYTADSQLSSMIAATLSNSSNGALAAMQSNRQVAVAGYGMGVTAGQWVPFAKAIITAIAISITPMLVIFVATPMSGAAISTIIGFFIWLAAWGVCDAIIHSAIMDYSHTYFSSIQNSKYSLDYYLNMPNTATKMLAMFGYARTAGIMLATVISGMVTRFGGQAMSMLANSLMGSMQSAGTKGGASAFSPEEKSSMLSQAARTSANYDNREKFSISGEQMAARNQIEQSYGSMIGTRAAAESAGTTVAGMAAAQALASGVSGAASAIAGGRYSNEAMRRNADIGLAGDMGAAGAHGNAENAFQNAERQAKQGIYATKATEEFWHTGSDMINKKLVEQGNAPRSREQNDQLLSSFGQYATIGNIIGTGGDGNKKMAIEEGKARSMPTQMAGGQSLGLKADEHGGLVALGSEMVEKEDHDRNFANKDRRYGLFSNSWVRNMDVDEHGQALRVSSRGFLTKENEAEYIKVLENVAKTNPEKASAYRDLINDIKSGRARGTVEVTNMDTKTGIGDISITNSIGENFSVSQDKSSTVNKLAYRRSGYKGATHATDTADGEHGNLRLGNQNLPFVAETVTKLGDNRFQIPNAFFGDKTAGSVEFTGSFNPKTKTYKVDRLLSLTSNSGFNIDADTFHHDMFQGRPPTLLFNSSLTGQSQNAARTAIDEVATQDIARLVKISSSTSSGTNGGGGGEVNALILTVGGEGRTKTTKRITANTIRNEIQEIRERTGNDGHAFAKEYVKYYSNLERDINDPNARLKYEGNIAKSSVSAAKDDLKQNGSKLWGWVKEKFR